MFTPTGLTENLNRIYDQGFASEFHEVFFDHSGFSNFGYWEAGITEAARAAENLVLKLIEPVLPLTGPVLDVACGQGGTTRTLSRFVAPGQITAINISQQQLKAAAGNAPGCHFEQMSATRMRFPDQVFSHLLCVEAVFHFETRRRFLREAFRVLQPGGWLVLTDVRFRLSPPAQIIPPANHLHQWDKYPELYLEAGFASPKVISARAPTWAHCCKALKTYGRQRLRQQGPAGLREWGMNELRCKLYDTVIQDYLLVWAQKPAKA